MSKKYLNELTNDCIVAFSVLDRTKFKVIKIDDYIIALRKEEIYDTRNWYSKFNTMQHLLSTYKEHIKEAKWFANEEERNNWLKLK